jgi:hypothetical protein
MPNYSKSIIYKLCCKDPIITDIYIGSTTHFIERKCAHKNGCNKEKLKSYVYEFIREHGNWQNWDMVQIESYNAENKRELESRERYWIETLKSSLNKNIPTQSPAEYKEKNKEKITEYRHKNKEKIAENNSEYYQNNKEKIADQQAKYYQNNKEKITDRNAEYYKNNKEKVAEKVAEKVICECGSEIRKDSLAKHKKSKKHINSKTYQL